MKTRTPKAPKGLCREATKIWNEVINGWDLDESTLIILEEACRCYHRLTQARGILAAEGLTIVNPRTGQVHAHPCLQAEKESRSGFLMAWRMLGLDVEPPGSVGRPSGSGRV